MILTSTRHILVIVLLRVNHYYTRNKMVLKNSSSLSQQSEKKDNSVTITCNTDNMCIYKTAEVLLETLAQNMPSNALFLFSKHPNNSRKKKKKIIKIRTNLVTKDGM